MMPARRKPVYQLSYRLTSIAKATTSNGYITNLAGKITTVVQKTSELFVF